MKMVANASGRNINTTCTAVVAVMGFRSGFSVTTAAKLYQARTASKTRAIALPCSNCEIDELQSPKYWELGITHDRGIFLFWAHGPPFTIHVAPSAPSNLESPDYNYQRWSRLPHIVVCVVICLGRIRHCGFVHVESSDNRQGHCRGHCYCRADDDGSIQLGVSVGETIFPAVDELFR